MLFFRLVLLDLSEIPRVGPGKDVDESEIYGGNWSCYKLTDKVIASAEEKRAWIGCYNWVSIGVSMEREELGKMASVA